MSFRRVLIAVDGSPLAERAADVGGDLAKSLNAQTALVYVIDEARAYAPGVSRADMQKALEREGYALLDATAQRLGDPPSTRLLMEGNAAQEIIAAARDWNADLVVVATHGRSGMSRLVMGSTAESVIRQAPCPVVVVKA